MHRFQTLLTISTCGTAAWASYLSAWHRSGEEGIVRDVALDAFADVTAAVTAAAAAAAVATTAAPGAAAAAQVVVGIHA
jgi:hypothetical protein